MMTTPEGQSMYADYLTEAASILEDTSGTNIEDYATLKTTYYYIDEYYNENGFPPQAPSNMLSVCYNNDFSMNSQSDTTLIGFTMYDGSSQYAPFSLCETEINWLPLPANSRPIFSEESNSAYRFNLNPNDNGNINGKPYSFFANFHSFELFEDETDYVIPNLVSAIPPSGRKSLKINNTHIKYHVNRLSKKFVVDQDIYYYSFASIMENPNGHGNQQPYFTVKLKQAETGSVLSSKCYVSDVNNPFFDWVPSVSGKSTAPITYRTWTCDTFNLMPYYGDTLQIDFIAADCAYGGHWGYVYLSDLCVPCSQQPSILLDSIGQGCIEDLKKIEGSLHIDSSIYTLINLSLNIYHNESIVDTISHTSSYNTVTGRFLFSIDDVKYNSLTPNTCFDIRAIATLLNPEGDTVTLKSVTANTNTATEFDNDFCTGVTCCPNDTIMVDIQGSECIGGEGVLQSIFNLHFSIDTADLTPGYEIPLDQPLVITGGYIDGFELKLINGSEYIGSGILHVTDPDFVFGSNPNIYGSLFYVNGEDTCELIIVLPFFWYNLKCDETTILCEKLILDVTADTTYIGGSPFEVTISIDVVLPFISSDSCNLTKWMIDANRVDGGIYYPLSPNYSFEAVSLPLDSFATINYTLSYSAFSSMSALDIGFMNNCMNKTWCYASVFPSEWLDVDSSETICDDLISPSYFGSVIRDKDKNITHYVTNYTINLPFTQFEDCTITSWTVTVTWTDTNNVVHNHSSYNFSTSNTFPTILPLTFTASDWGKVASINFILESDCRSYCEYIHSLNNGSQRISMNEITDSFNVYPNPAKDFIIIEFDGIRKEGLLEIINQNGDVVKTIDVKNNDFKRIKVEAYQLKSGNYWIRWTTNGKYSMKPISIIK